MKMVKPIKPVEQQIDTTNNHKPTNCRVKKTKKFI